MASILVALRTCGQLSNNIIKFQIFGLINFLQLLRYLVLKFIISNSWTIIFLSFEYHVNFLKIH